MATKKSSKKSTTKAAAKKSSKKSTKAASTKGAKKGAKKAAAKLGSARAFAATVSFTTGKVEAIEAQEIKIKYLEEAYKFSEARNKDEIHPRKVLPKPPVGPKVLDMLPTAPMALEESVPMAALKAAKATLSPTDTISLVKNVQLNDVATSDTASHVCEPSAAINGSVVFYTGNWFAAVSIDGGTTFKFVNPFTTFPNPPGMSFCCDQVVHYIKSIDTFVWLLQYTRDSTGKNIQRIAYATTARVKTGSWRFFDITPASVGLGPGIWLDYPDLATGTNMLYMTSNAFTSAGSWRASVVVRIRLSSFTTGTLSATRFVSTTHPSLRVAQNCATTAFFVAHNSTSSLRVFKWPEGSAAPTSTSVAVASWSSGPYSSITPDGRNWLARADGRHTGATLAGNELWFGWGSAKGGANARPNPFIQIARINATTMALIQNVNLWSTSFAYCYVALNTNSNNEVGASHTIGGGTRFPTHVVAILTGTLRQVATFTGTRGPSDNKWGDYLTVRRNYANERLFCATGYTLQSGAGSSDATPNLTIFGRSTEV